MLDLFFQTSAFLRAFVYASIALSSLLVFSSYYKAYCKDKPTWIIKSVMLLFLGISFSFTFYLIAAIINLIEGHDLRYKIVVSLLGFTNIPLLLAIINFWDASVNQKN